MQDFAPHLVLGYRLCTVCVTAEQKPSFCRSVRVDPESVNSAAIDVEPQNKLVRMMVSAFLSLNPDGRTIITRDTTIMPQIPGMQAIRCLLCAPVAELR